VLVSPSGGISFRYNYRVNGRQETLTLGRYGAGGITLAQAREALVEARAALREGVSPARSKTQRELRKKAAAGSTGQGNTWASLSPGVM
jgi:hypothetical protein